MGLYMSGAPQPAAYDALLGRVEQYLKMWASTISKTSLPGRRTCFIRRVQLRSQLPLPARLGSEINVNHMPAEQPFQSALQQANLQLPVPPLPALPAADGNLEQ